MDTTPFTTDPVLERAAGYPYDITAHSFTYVRGATEAFDPTLTRGRRPVIGYGSNQSPARLRQKFGEAFAPIPVQRAVLADHDVVYSGHFAGYGSLPAALRRVPGTQVEVAVNWLDEDHLVAMHPTERDNYHFAELRNVVLLLDDGEALSQAYAYLGFRGHLRHEDGGTPVALAEIRAKDRVLPAMGQLDALEAVRRRLAPDVPLADFVRAHIDDAGLRAARIATLAALCVPAAHGEHAVIPYPA